MRFDIEQYTGDCVMNCKSIDDATRFLEYLNITGRTWCDRQSYSPTTLHYQKYRENTCYAFNEGRYGSYGYYSDNGYTILNFEDFDWDDDITTSSKDIKRIDTFLASFISI